MFVEDADRATPLALAKAAGNVGCTLLLERAEAKAHEAANCPSAPADSTNGPDDPASIGRESV